MNEDTPGSPSIRYTPMVPNTSVARNVAYDVRTPCIKRFVRGHWTVVSRLLSQRPLTGLSERPLEAIETWFLGKLFIRTLQGKFAFASYGVRLDAVGECQAMIARDFQTRQQDADVR
ncbi:MAG: hypothetical protein DRP09_21725 [Candidatus Thorarchaeota archaeon]|nr:MAG: hypothetical protein DRP09_21725 [Candidatus Thorarchaeota archaeon]